MQLSNKRTEIAEGKSMFKLKNGDPAPEIELRDARGNDFKLSDRRGKMVVLHFCRGEY